MKKFFVTVLSLAVAAAAAFAQDYNAAMEAYNNAAVAETKAAQIAGFREAMTLFAACEDEDAPAQVAKCQENIVNISFGIVTDDIKAKNFDQALLSLDAAVAAAQEFGQDVEERKNKQLGNIYNGAANASFGKKDAAAAVDNAKKAIEINEAVGATYFFLGWGLSQQKDVDGAIEALEKANEMGMGKQALPLLSNQYLAKCQAANKAGKFADAVEMADKALEYNPNNANAYKLRGNANTSLNKIAEAIDDFNKYLELNPNAKDAEGIKKTIAQLKAAKK